MSAQPWIQVTFSDQPFEIHQIGVAGHDFFICCDEYIINYHVRYGLLNQSMSLVLQPDSTEAMVRVLACAIKLGLVYRYFPEVHMLMKWLLTCHRQ